MISQFSCLKKIYLTVYLVCEIDVCRASFNAFHSPSTYVKDKIKHTNKNGTGFSIPVVYLSISTNTLVIL